MASLKNSFCTLFFGVAVISSLLGCSNEGSFMTPPLTRAFPLNLQGNRTEFDVRIKEKYIYAIDLDYSYQDQSDRQRVWNLVQRVEKNNDKEVTLGPPMRLRIIVRQIGKPQDILNQEIVRPPLSSWGAKLSANLVQQKLEPGDYQVIIEVVESAVELKSVFSEVSISRAYLGK